MFGKNLFSKDDDNFRNSARMPGRGLRATIDDSACDLLDYSEGGVRIRFRGQPRRVVVIEITRGKTQLRRSAAVLAWRRGDQAGYAFRSSLKLHDVQTHDDVEPPRRTTSDSGGVSGDALRDRLRL